MLTDTSRSQLARYEAFAELAREMMVAADLPQVAELVVARMKYVTNIHAWRFLGLNTEPSDNQIEESAVPRHFLCIDGALGQVKASYSSIQQLSSFELTHWKAGKAVFFEGADLAAIRESLPGLFQNALVADIEQVYLCPHWEAGQLLGLFWCSIRAARFEPIDVKFIGMVASFFHRKVNYLLTEQRLNDAVKEARHQTEQANVALAAQLSLRTGELHIADESLTQVRIDYQKAYPMAMMAALVPSLAHDLNTQLGNTRIATNTLRDSFNEFSHMLSSGSIRRTELERFLLTLDEGLGISETGISRICDLVSNLKQMSIDQVTQRRRSFDVDQLINEVMVSLSPSLRKRSITVARAIPPALRMDSYPGPLGQVITNLVQNALTHAFNKRSGGTITLAAAALPDQHLRLTVADNGNGMSTAVTGRLFEPFFTTKSGQGGSGIGLAFSRRLVEETLGGHIDFESDEGGGTRFTIELPCVAPAQSTS